MILVTGGAGFIGSNLVRRLLADGKSVIVVDNEFTGSKSNLPDHPRLFYRWGDVRNNGWAKDIQLHAGVSQIYHLACPASPKAFGARPFETLMINLLGTLNVLAFAKRQNARILFTSTSEIYGDPTEHPQRETYWGNTNPLGPRSCYDEGKRAAETICQEHRGFYGTDVVIARLFNTYGPFMAPDDGRVISNFITQALRGERLTVYGDGTQTRSFCYVDDTVDGLIRLMESAETGPINIGNPHEVTLANLVWRLDRLFQNVTGRPLAVDYFPLPTDDPTRRCPDISVAMDKLNWEPAVGLNEGLKRTIEYFRAVTSSADTSGPVRPSGETDTRATV